jgi:TrmH family RNA methyltransferase
MITSLQHPLVKHWFLLRSDRAYREDAQRLLVVGEKMIRELSDEIGIEALATLNPAPGIRAKEKHLVSESILKRVTGLEQPDGFAAEIVLPPPQDLSSKNFVMVLDQVSDPGNLGTLLRTALALGWEGVILTAPGTVDLFNDKALRASKGACLRLPYCRLSPEAVAAWIEEKRVHAFAADIEGKSLDSLSFKPPLALILSSESQGPRPWPEAWVQKVTIPMAPNVESLNVASSGAILLYSMRPS